MPDQTWQPISTFPDDFEDKAIFWLVPRTEAENRAMNNRIFVPGAGSERAYFGTHESWFFGYKATHWMPLPDPPSRESLECAK